MLWNIIVWLFWIGIALSFVVTLVMTIMLFIGSDEPFGARAAMFVGMWIRWGMGLIGSLIGLFILGLVLNWLGFSVRGIAPGP